MVPYIFIATLFVFIILILAWIILVGQVWIRALLSGVRLSPIQILLMRLRKNPANLILSEMIKISNENLEVSRDDLEALHMAGGNITNVVDGLLYAKANSIKLDFVEASKLDSRKHNIVNYLRENN